MKLAFLTATFPSLTETFVFREWEYLQRDSGFNIHVFAIRKPRDNWRMQLPEGVDVETTYLRPDLNAVIPGYALIFPFIHPVRWWRMLRLFIRELPAQTTNQYGPLLFQLVAGMYLGSRLKRGKFDAIHGHFNSASNIALFAHLSSGIPFSYTVYANDDLFMGPAFFEEKLRHCRNVVTDTEYNQRTINLLSRFRYEEKIRVVYSGVDMNVFRDASAKAGFSNPVRLLSVGSLTGFKGYPSVIEALSKVREAGIDVEYRIVGGGSEAEEAMLNRLKDRHGVGDRVQLLGARGFDEVQKQLEWCDVFIMASEIHARGKRDGFPTVIIEAMLARRLVIASYISDIPNNVRDKHTGLLVPEKSPEQLADAIQYACRHQSECEEMVDRAYRMAKVKYDAAVNYGKLADILHSEVDPPSPIA